MAKIVPYTQNSNPPPQAGPPSGVLQGLELGMRYRAQQEARQQSEADRAALAARLQAFLGKEGAARAQSELGLAGAGAVGPAGSIGQAAPQAPEPVLDAATMARLPQMSEQGLAFLMQDIRADRTERIFEEGRTRIVRRLDDWRRSGSFGEDEEDQQLAQSIRDQALNAQSPEQLAQVEQQSRALLGESVRKNQMRQRFARRNTGIEAQINDYASTSLDDPRIDQLETVQRLVWINPELDSETYAKLWKAANEVPGASSSRRSAGQLPSLAEYVIERGKNGLVTFEEATQEYAQLRASTMRGAQGMAGGGAGGGFPSGGPSLDSLQGDMRDRVLQAAGQAAFSARAKGGGPAQQAEAVNALLSQAGIDPNAAASPEVASALQKAIKDAEKQATVSGLQDLASTLEQAGGLPGARPSNVEGIRAQAERAKGIPKPVDVEMADMIDEDLDSLRQTRVMKGEERARRETDPQISITWGPATWVHQFTAVESEAAKAKGSEKRRLEKLLSRMSEWARNHPDPAMRKAWEDSNTPASPGRSPYFRFGFRTEADYSRAYLAERTAATSEATAP